MAHKLFSALSFLFVLSVLPFGCQTAPKETGTADLMQWDSRARIKDTQKNKTQTVSIDVVGRRSDGRIRMDMSAVMGIPVATFVMDRQGFSCALYRQKKFYEGPLSEKALLPFLRTSVSPEVLRNIVFDEEIRGADWRCEKNSAGEIGGCDSRRQQTQVKWERQETGRTVRLVHPNVEIQWNFKNPSTEVQAKDGLFQLSAPSGFKLIRL